MIKKYIRTLEALKDEDTIFSEDKSYCFLLSGQSNLKNCALSCEQKQILEIFRDNNFNIIERGFPFNTGHNCNEFTTTPIIKASLYNTLQFLHITFNDRYKKIVAKHLQRAFYAEKVVIICQSMGLYMLQNSLQYLNIPSGCSITIVALGPVTFKPFNDDRFQLKVIKGKNDYLSRFINRNKANCVVPWGHLDYCHCDMVIQYIKNSVL